MKGIKHKILDDGVVMLVDYMGEESAVVQAARVSYGDGTKTVNDDVGLLRYLMQHHHTTPFEMCELKFLVRCPMDVWRQWIRHRTASVNEYSTRYSNAIDSAMRTENWRVQSGTNKQGSGDYLDPALKVIDLPEVPFGEDLKVGQLYKCTETCLLVFVDTAGERREIPINWDFNSRSVVGILDEMERDTQSFARNVYETRIAAGVAREQARKDLPLSTYTEAYWKIDLHNLLHFLRLRMDSHAQYEIRMYANKIGEIVKALYPNVWAAFENFRLNAVTLFGDEIEYLRTGVKPELWTNRREADFQKKKELLGLS